MTEVNEALVVETPEVAIETTEPKSAPELVSILLNSLSFSDLLPIRDQVVSLLTEKAEAARNELATQAAALAGFFGTGTDAILTKPKVKREREAPKRYRDPTTGTIWIGKGPRPDWLNALVEAGTDIKTLLVTE
jgi:DNA-binding protein H-NS